TAALSAPGRAFPGLRESQVDCYNITLHLMRPSPGVRSGSCPERGLNNMNKLCHSLAGAVAAASLRAAPTHASEVVSRPDTRVSATAYQRHAAELSSAVGVLQGDALVRRRAASLGDTLAGLPGVQSSGFGPGVG